MPTPSLPLGNRLPWVLGVVSLVLLGYGLLQNNDEAVLIGAVGAAGTFVAFILPRLILPKD